MENGAIKDRQITASSRHSSYYDAYRGRLHYKASGGGWLSYYSNTYQWLQVDFGHQNTIVTGLATQGRYAANQWVTKYRMQHRLWSDVSFAYYREQGQILYKVKKPCSGKSGVLFWDIYAFYSFYPSLGTQYKGARGGGRGRGVGELNCPKDYGLIL